MAIIKSTAARVITDYGNEREFLIPNGYVGEIPEWVERHPYFQQCLDSKEITFVQQILYKETKHDTEEAAKKAAELKAAIKEARENAAEEAAKDADSRGLDETAKKAYIKQQADAAVKAVKESAN